MLRSAAVRCRAYTCLFVPLKHQVSIPAPRCFHASAVTAAGHHNLPDMKKLTHRTDPHHDKHQTPVHDAQMDVNPEGEEEEEEGKSKIRAEYFKFADEETHATLYDGVRYDKLPVVNIQATSNNTIISICRGDNGKFITNSTCGSVGFKNAKKGTNIAAQVCAVALAQKALDKGYKTVRVVVKGIGPGRIVSIKSLAETGLEIVSITDNTQIRQKMRARKKRRL